MQRPCDAKRKKIVESAARLFAEKPFHEVRLDDVAMDARVGKGTLYVYFPSKEDLFDALLVESFERMFEQVKGVAEDDSLPSWEMLSNTVFELTTWAVNSPHFFNLMRHGEGGPPTPRLRERRRDLGELIRKIIERGVERGEFDDPHPEMTAQFIPGCVRGALRFGPEHIDPKLVTEQIMRVIGGGIRRSDGIEGRTPSHRATVRAAATV